MKSYSFIATATLALGLIACSDNSTSSGTPYAVHFERSQCHRVNGGVPIILLPDTVRMEPTALLYIKDSSYQVELNDYYNTCYLESGATTATAERKGRTLNFSIDADTAGCDEYCQFYVWLDIDKNDADAKYVQFLDTKYRLQKIDLNDFENPQEYFHHPGRPIKRMSCDWDRIVLPSPTEARLIESEDGYQVEIWNLWIDGATDNDRSTSNVSLRGDSLDLSINVNNSFITQIIQCQVLFDIEPEQATAKTVHIDSLDLKVVKEYSTEELERTRQVLVSEGKEPDSTAKRTAKMSKIREGLWQLEVSGIKEECGLNQDSLKVYYEGSRSTSHIPNDTNHTYGVEINFHKYELYNIIKDEDIDSCYYDIRFKLGYLLEFHHDFARINYVEYDIEQQ